MKSILAVAAVVLLAGSTSLRAEEEAEFIRMAHEPGTIGYTNVYELGPLIDVNKSALTFEGSLRSL
jgi:hypothetical protein